MTIGGWIAFVLFAALILCAGIAGACLIENVPGKIISVAVAILLILGLFFGMRWYFQNTASGQRAMTDQKSDLDNGLERTVTIYTADGEFSDSGFHSFFSFPVSSVVERFCHLIKVNSNLMIIAMEQV